MQQLLDLLQVWSELEPGICSGSQVTGWYIRFKLNNTPQAWSVSVGGSLRLAKVQAALQYRVVNHGLQVEIKWNGIDWNVFVRHPAMAARTFESSDAEAAIALLSAYVQWLKHCVQDS